MISLNRPYDFKCNSLTATNSIWAGARATYSSREGLNLIYQQLYADRGSMRVAVSPLTCFVAIYPIVANGHTPVYIDIDPLTLNMSEEELIQRKDIDAVQVIYLGGNPMRMDKVIAWAEETGVVIIEDCAQALGARYQGREVGTFGDYAVASAVKNLYVEAGGLLIGGHIRINCEQCEVSEWLMVYKRMKRYLEKKANLQRVCVWNMLYGGLLKLKYNKNNGFSNTIHALPKSVETKIKIKLGQLGVINMKRKSKAQHLMSKINQEQYFIQQEPDAGESTRNRILLVSKHHEAREIIVNLRANGIAANNLTQSYTHPYQEHIRNDEMLGKYYTEELKNYETILPYVLCVPCSPALLDEEIDYIADKLRERTI